LIVDDDKSLCSSLEGLLVHEGYRVEKAFDPGTAFETAKQIPIDLVLLDLRLGAVSGLEVLPKIKELRPEAAVIMISAMATIESAVEAMRLGADNFVTKPLDPSQLLAMVAKGIETERLRRRSEQLDRLSASRSPGVFSESQAMGRVIALAEKVADRDTTVLLTGETGTGKGVVGGLIHNLSPRSRNPFVELNCAGLQRELTESELFGHERGAFTGAGERKLGLFEAAEGGTLLLDEVGEMDSSVQAKLLKVLESQRFRRLGGVSEIETDVRLIAATHRDLPRAVSDGRFREDLLYRLNVFEIPIPPLRERRDDILPLARRFLAEFRPEEAVAITSDAEEALLAYSWPGNVRELRNVIERAAILCLGCEAISTEHLPPLSSQLATDSEADFDGLAAIEKRAVEDALAASSGSIKAAAAALGVSRGTLYRKIEKFGLDPK